MSIDGFTAEIAAFLRYHSLHRIAGRWGIRGESAMTHKPRSGWVLLLVVAVGCSSDAPVRDLGQFPPVRPRPAASVAPQQADGIGGHSTLRDLESHLVRSNPALRALRHDERGQLAREAQASSLPDPRLKYAEAIEEVQTRTGPQERKLGFDWRIPEPGRWFARQDRARAEGVAAVARADSATRKMIRRLREEWAELYYLAAALGSTRESVEIVRSLEKVVRQRLSAGIANHADLIRLQSELASLEDHLVGLEEKRTRRAAVVNEMLDRPADSPLPVPSTPSGSDSSTLSSLPPRPTASGHPRLKVANGEIDAASARLSEAKRGNYPDLVIGAETILTGASPVIGTPGSGDDPWLITIGIELPFGQGRIQATEREAQARLSAARARRVVVRRELEREVAEKGSLLRDAQRREGLLLGTLLPKGEEALNACLTAYSSGTVEFQVISESQRQLLEYRLGLARARSDQARARAALWELLGLGDEIARGTP